jgi:hypothetical protein
MKDMTNKLSTTILAGSMMFTNASWIYGQQQPNTVKDELQLSSVRTHHLHSKLLDRRTFQGSLLEKARREGKAGYLVGPGMNFFPYPDDGHGATLPGYAKHVACNADAVIVGSVRNRESFLTESQESVFTENIVSVEQILKDNIAHPLAVASNIVVARSGGHIVTPEGYHIEVIDTNFPALQLGGQYLLSLKYVPSTMQYMSADREGTFSIVGQRAHRLISDSVPDSTKRQIDFQSFSELIRQSLVNCKKDGGAR